MYIKKLVLSYTYTIGGIGWIKPGVEAEINEQFPINDDPVKCLDRLKSLIENWVSINYPGAQLSGEPEELPIIRRYNGDDVPRGTSLKQKADSKILDQWVNGGAKIRQTIESIYDITNELKLGHTNVKKD